MDRTRVAVAVYANYLILLFGAFTYLLQNFVWFSLPALLPELMDDVHLTGTQVGILNGIIPFIYIFLSLGAGMTIDRFGSRLGIGVAMLLFGSGQLFRSFAGDFVTLFATTILIGVGATGISMGLPKIVADYFPATRSGSMSSGYLVGAYAGSAITFLFARPFLSPLLGDWRAVFYWSGLFAVVVGVVWFPVIGQLDSLYRRQSGTTANRTGEGNHNDRGSDRPLRDEMALLLSYRDLRLVVVMGTMLLALTHGFRGWLPTILDTSGFSATLAATVVTVLVVGQLVGTLCIPPLSDRFQKRRPAIVLSGCGTVVGSVGIFYTPTVAITAAAVFLVGLGLGGVSPLVRAIPLEMEEVGPKLTGTAVGFIFTIGEVGGFLAPSLIGLLEDVYGSFAPGIAFLIACAAMLVLTGVLMDEPGEANAPVR